VNFTEDLESSSSPHTIPTFTPDQYNHLLKLIDKDSLIQKSVANMTGNHFTSPHAFSTSHSCFFADKNDTTCWIVDTGATDHMVHNLDTLLNPTPILLTFNTVYLPNNQTTEVIHTGSCNLFDNNVVHNVLYIPQFSYNLFSISKLTKEAFTCSYIPRSHHHLPLLFIPVISPSLPFQ